MIKNALKKFFKSLAQFKFLYDVGGMWLTLINFALLIMANSEKILKFIPLKGPHATLTLALVSIPLGFILVIIAGAIMMKSGFYAHYKNEASGRDPVMAETLNCVKHIEEVLNEQTNNEEEGRKLSENKQ